MADYIGSFSGSFTGSFNGTYEGVSSQVQYTLINGIPVTITPFQKNSIIANNNFRQNVFPPFSASVDSRINNNTNDRLELSSSLANRVTENSSSIAENNSSIVNLSTSTNILSSSLANRVTENSSSIVNLSTSTNILSSSLANRVTENSSSIAALSSSLYEFSSSLNYSSGSYSGSFKGNGSLLTNIDADNTELQQELKVNQNVGGIAKGEQFDAGTSVEEMLRQILIQYIPPTIGTPLMKNDNTTISTSTREVGESFTANTASFTAVADDPNGNFPFSASFTSSGATIQNVEVYFGDNVLGSSNGLGIGSSYIYTRNTEGNINFKINGVNSENEGSVTSERNYNFKYKQFFGATDTEVSDSTGVRSLSNSNFTNTNSFTTPIFNEKHFTIAIPDTKTLTSVITANNENITSQFILSTFNVQDGGGTNVSYNVYRFNSAEALDVVATVTLS